MCDYSSPFKIQQTPRTKSEGRDKGSGDRLAAGRRTKNEGETLPSVGSCGRAFVPLSFSFSVNQCVDLISNSDACTFRMPCSDVQPATSEFVYHPYTANSRWNRVAS